MKFRLTLLIILASLSLAACSLAEDITPPPNYSTSTSLPTIVLPTQPPAPTATNTLTPTTAPTSTSTELSPVATDSTTTPAESGAVATSTTETTPAATSYGTTVPEGTTTPEPITVNVSGTVTLSKGAAVPDGTIATLLVYDTNAGQVTQTLTAPVPADGKYEFKNVAADTNTVLLVTVEYSGVTYDSVPAHFDGTVTQFDMPITVFETTADVNNLTITQAHLQFDFSTAGQVQVMVLYVVTNPGQNAVTVPSDGTTVPFIQIPEGAQSASFQLAQSSSPLLSASNGFALLPGANLQYGIIASFNLPYTKKLEFSQPFNLPVSSATIIVPEGVKVNSNQLTDAGTQGSSGTTYHLYSASSLASGSTLTLTISGMPGDKPGFSIDPRTWDSRTWLMIGIGVVGLILIGLGVFLFLRDRKLRKMEEEFSGDEESGEGDALGDDREGIMDAIIALDDQFKAGEISQDAYETRRGELKERLKILGQS